MDTRVNTLMPKTSHAITMFDWLNGRDANMSFTFQCEKQNRLSFLDIAIILEDKTFTTSVYGKPNVSGFYTHFDSFFTIYL